MNLINQPQNFNSNSYNSSPQQTNNNYSIKSKIALVLSVLGCTAIIGCILAIVDITKKDGTNKKLSKIALGVCSFWLLFSIILSKANKKTNNNVTQTVEITTETVEETTEIATMEETTADNNENESDGTFNYVDNTEIDKFITNYNNIAQYDIINIEHNEVSEWKNRKFKGEINECSIEINDICTTTALQYLKLEIYTKGKTHLGQEVDLFENMTNVLPDVIKTLNNSVSDEDIQQIITEISETDKLIENKIIGNDILLHYYSYTDNSRIEIDFYDEYNFDFIIDSTQIGEYGFEKVFNTNTDFEEKQIMYHIPAGTYNVTNLDNNRSGISVYSDENIITTDGFEEPSDTLCTVSLNCGDTDKIIIEDGYYVEINGNYIAFTKKEDK